MIELSLILGTYALTLALIESEGAWGFMEHIRNNRYIDDFGLLNCFLCTSFWVSIALCVAFGRLDLVLLAWGGSVVLERLINAYMVK